MYTDEQLKIAETFLGTAVTSGVLSNDACQEMINRIRSQDEVLLSFKEVEARLGISRSTVERMATKKQLKKVKINGLVRITKSSVDAVIESVISAAEDTE